MPPVRCCSGILSFQELLYPLLGNAEVEVVRSAELCKVHGYEVAVFVYYGASARALQRRYAVQQALSVGQLCYLAACHLHLYSLLGVGKHQSGVVAYHVQLLVYLQRFVCPVAAKQSVQTSLIASVANMYYTLLMLDEQLNLTQETAKLWEKNVKTMEAMQVAAMTNSAAVAQAKANYQGILATIPTLEQSIRSTENTLCSVLHQAPQPIARGRFDQQQFPADLSVGVPLQLLSNRPDVKMAEMTLRSAVYDTNLAHSAFYPSITLSGSAGWTNNGGGAITNPGKFLASAIGSLVQPLFNNGALRANLKIAKAEEESALLGFEQALLNAGEEVSTTLGAYQTAVKQAESRQKQVDQLEKAAKETWALFQHDRSTTYLETLTAQQSLISAQLDLISDKFDRMQAVISLYQALGGGRN